MLAGHFARRAEVWILASVESDLRELGDYFGLDPVRVSLLAVGAADETEAEAEILRLRPDVLINNSYGSVLRNRAPRGIYMCMFPHSEEGSPSRRESLPSAGGSSVEAIRTYTEVTANSEFTRHWIWRRWGITSTVVYSPCDSMGPPRPKSRRILHVGRFSDPRRTPHRKKQDILIETFAAMEQLHRDGWRLALAGSVDPDGGDAELERLRRAAGALPVDFHPGVSRLDLRRLYQQSALYWHATGFRSEDTAAPEEQEHFGVTIVEGMSAGAVPVVHDSGGPREIVRHAYDGYRWKDLEELRSRTAEVVGDPAKRERMAARAVRGSRRFSREKFLRRVDRILAS
ncbi:MAG TPA: glycosyltransferase [Thermoanaerobaculia bacterium]